MTNKLSKTLI